MINHIGKLQGIHEVNVINMNYLTYRCYEVLKKAKTVSVSSYDTVCFSFGFKKSNNNKISHMLYDISV